MDQSMKRRRWRAPSPSMIVACIALFVALGGTSYAAVTLPANSVGTTQLKNSAVTGDKVKTATLSGNKIVNGAIGAVGQADSLKELHAAWSLGL